MINPNDLINTLLFLLCCAVSSRSGSGAGAEIRQLSASAAVGDGWHSTNYITEDALSAFGISWAIEVALLRVDFAKSSIVPV